MLPDALRGEFLEMKTRVRRRLSTNSPAVPFCVLIPECPVRANERKIIVWLSNKEAAPEPAKAPTRSTSLIDYRRWLRRWLFGRPLFFHPFARVADSFNTWLPRATV